MLNFLIMRVSSLTQMLHGVMKLSQLTQPLSHGKDQITLEEPLATTTLNRSGEELVISVQIAVYSAQKDH